MKTTEAKTTHSNPSQAAKGNQPFFNKGGEGSFFSKEAPPQDFFFNPATIQAKLTIGAPNDPYEQEADAMAEKVVQRLAVDSSQSAVGSGQFAVGSSQSAVGSPEVQAKCAACGEEEKVQKMEGEEEEVMPKLQKKEGEEEEEVMPKLQMKEGEEEEEVMPKLQMKEGEEEEEVMPKLQMKAIFESNEEQPVGTVQRKAEGGASVASPDLESRLSASRGGGQSLPEGTRSSMESAFGADFSGVRVHTGGESVQMNKELGAQAFTHGADVYFGAGKYDTGSTDGQRLLGHELTHVVQQGASVGKLNAQPVALNVNEKNIQREEEEDGERREDDESSGQVCPVPSHCPSEFCTPFASRTVAEATRLATKDGLLFGISQAVNSRVVPFWEQHIDGGTGLQNLDGTFGADFTASPTTLEATSFLMSAITAHLQDHPPAFPPGTDTLTLDITTLIPEAIAAIDRPGDPDSMNFDVIGDVGGNLAGGIGKDETTYPVGARPSPINDSREAFGQVVVTRNPDGSLTLTSNIRFQVRDTIDLCPGNCGDGAEMLATIPLSKFEASGISGDVPFEVSFPGPGQTASLTPSIAPTPTDRGRGTTTASYLRIREAPSLTAPILGRYRRGSSIEILEETIGTEVDGVNTWYRTDRGYVSGRYVRFGGAVEAAESSNEPIVHETSEATSDAQIDHFYIELKAWIPHPRVVDPEENMRVSDWLDTIGDLSELVPTPTLSRPDYEYSSHYRGDNHHGYGGSYRVLSTIAFDWDGATISNFVHHGSYGVSHRDYAYRVFLDNQWPIPDLELFSGSDSESATATTATAGSKTSSNSFVASLASANPLIMTWAPDIDSRLSGGFRTVGGNPCLFLEYSTDLFPSHGFKVSKNGEMLTSEVVNDASRKIVLGPVGAAVVGQGLTSHSNNGNALISL